MTIDIVSKGLKKDFKRGTIEERMATRAFVGGAKDAALRAAKSFETMADFGRDIAPLVILNECEEESIEINDLAALAVPM